MKGKTISKVIAYILIALLLVAVAGIAYKLIKGSDGDKVTGVELDNTEITFTENDVSSGYAIEYLVSGDATNLADITVNGIERAAVGDTVTFTVTVNEEDYFLSEIRLSVLNSAETPELTETDGKYSFVMPQGNVYVWVYVSYTPEILEQAQYMIEYDTLGWGSGITLDISCPSHAGAGETVTFTASIKSEYATELKISRIVVQLGSGEDYIEDLQGNNGSYTFTMPDTETMEEEVNEGYITLMFYIIPIDM